MELRVRNRHIEWEAWRDKGLWADIQKGLLVAGGPLAV